MELGKQSNLRITPVLDSENKPEPDKYVLKFNNEKIGWIVNGGLIQNEEVSSELIREGRGMELKLDTSSMGLELPIQYVHYKLPSNLLELTESGSLKPVSAVTKNGDIYKYSKDGGLTIIRQEIKGGNNYIDPHLRDSEKENIENEESKDLNHTLNKIKSKISSLFLKENKISPHQNNKKTP